MRRRGDQHHLCEPQDQGGFTTWTFEDDQIHVSFVGKGPEGSRAGAYEAVTDDPGRRLAWPHQIHSSTVLAVDEGGMCGEADAMTTRGRHLALSVATADCVPVVAAGERGLAVIHAGWRGLSRGIVAHAVSGLSEPAAALRAWIGPAIGVCCYEVGDEVADEVAAASNETVRHETAARPHLDLTAATEIQLRRQGIEHIEVLRVCTRCHPDWLWSYRLDRDQAGRNWTFAWLR